MADELSKLLSSMVRPLVTLLLTGTLCWGFVVGKIPQEQFLTIVVMAISFWFGTRTADTRRSDGSR